jgi:hypothetical protein
VRFGKQHNVTGVIIDDKPMDNSLTRSNHLREDAFEALRKKCRELEEENERLRKLLAEHGVAPAPSPAMPSVEPATVIDACKRRLKDYDHAQAKAETAASEGLESRDRGAVLGSF